MDLIAPQADDALDVFGILTGCPSTRKVAEALGATTARLSSYPLTPPRKRRAVAETGATKGSYPTSGTTFPAPDLEPSSFLMLRAA